MSIRRFYRLFLLCLTCSFLLGCFYTFPHRPGYDRVIGRTTNKGEAVSSGWKEEGVISYYGKDFHGKKTANGEKFDMEDMTAAHRTLPFNTNIRVTIIETGESITVRINDRGPFKKGRILDLSYGAAKKIGLIAKGSAKAKLELL